MNTYHDEDDEPREWEVGREEEKEDRHPVLGGTAPVARVAFLGLVLLVALLGALALVRALGSFFGP